METPAALRPFECHGVEFTATSGDNECVGICPFCLDEGHFYANGATGLWDCKKCGEEGNVVTFLEKIVETRLEDTTPLDPEQACLGRVFASSF